MSKQSHQAKVYTMLKDANGPVTVEQLLSIPGLLPYKLSAYVLYAKIDFGAVIVPVRDGRKVIAYQMADAGAGVPAKTAAPVAVVAKTPKTPKAKKNTVAVSVPSVPEVDLKSDPIVSRSKKVVDILDEMDTDVASFEDREFAAEFVRSL